MSNSVDSTVGCLIQNIHSQLVAMGGIWSGIKGMYDIMHFVRAFGGEVGQSNAPRTSF